MKQNFNFVNTFYGDSVKKLKKIIFFLLTLAICVGLVYFISYILPSKKIGESNVITIYDRNNEILIQTHYDVEGNYLKLDEINECFIYAFIASEDENFFNHLGFSIKGISRAVLTNISNKDSQGGSTITQQLSRSLFLDNEKSIMRKVKEAFITINLETHYEKNEILEQYLNSIFLGHNLYGVESASKYYFSKTNKELTIDEIAMIVGIANAPNLNAPDINYENAMKRRNYVLNRLYKIGYITKEILNENLRKETIIKINKINFTNPSMHIYYYVKNQLEMLGYSNKKTLARGINVYTTIDKKTQENLYKIISKNNPKNNSEIASIIMKSNSSDVLAFVGGYNLDDQYNRAIYSKRPMGSTIKPLLYYLALLSKLNPDTYFDCSKTTFNIKGYEPYSPNNAMNKYANRPINMIEAIGLSDNIYATKTLLYVGFSNFQRLLKMFDIDTNIVPSSALGVDETSLLNLTAIYNTFASLGTYYKPRIISYIETKDNTKLYKNSQIAINKLRKPFVFILNQLLTAPFDEKLIDYAKPTLINYKSKYMFSAKTGSDDYNSYTIAYNPNYVISVWSGTDNNEIFTTKNISKQVFKEIANSIESHNYWYNPPSYIETRIINPITCKLSKTGSIYWFFKDN